MRRNDCVGNASTNIELLFIGRSTVDARTILLRCANLDSLAPRRNWRRPAFGLGRGMTGLGQFLMPSGQLRNANAALFPTSETGYEAVN